MRRSRAGEGVRLAFGLFVVTIALAGTSALSGAWPDGGWLPTARAAQVGEGRGIEAANRPIKAIHLKGLKKTPEQLVRNQVRSESGQPYDPKTVRQDIVRITHLGRFSSVRAAVTPRKDGSVVLTFVMKEQPLLRDVEVVGNKAISDQTLMKKVVLRAGDPADPFLIRRGVRRIEKAYQDKGYFVASATVDKQLLRDQRILIYRVREGPKVRIDAIRFKGNGHYTADQLESKIHAQTYFPVLHDGELNREQLQLDADRLRKFYQDHGYLDAQVGRRIDLTPNQTSAAVTFLINEGKQYTVAKIRVEGNEIFPAEQIRMNMAVAPGGVYTRAKLRDSSEAIVDIYGKLGFISTKVNIVRLFHEDEPKVDLVVRITEGSPSTVGTITVRGNDVTRSKVILRQVRGMKPGRPFDRAGIEQTRQRLTDSPLFSQGAVTVLGQPDDPVRDVLIDVKEQNTGSVVFGAGLSSDAGVIGAINVTQRNFDITNTPESFKQLITGQAFRGNGQYFALSLQPGTETSRYSVHFRDPYVFDSDYFLDTSVFFYQREQINYNEQRIGGNLGIGEQFGDVWSASLRGRAASVNIDNIDQSAPTDVFDVAGTSVITGLGVEVVRNTTDSNIFPTQGSRLSFGVERAGALGGDYDFTRVSAQLDKFWTVDRDFFGRATVVSLGIQTGYIFGSAPVFERYYAGGHSSFRGFSYRGVGPRGIENNTGRRGDDPVGGSFEFLSTLQYNFPIYENTLRGVLFTDQGTVQKDFGFDQWRVAVGAGIRLQVPFLGRAPVALDFAVPLLKEDGDDTQIVSFDLALPFR